MVLSYNFLKKHFNITQTPQEIYELFTKHSIEIEKMYNSTDVEGILTGKIISKVKHPESTKLNICNVDYGQGIKQILCGAPNVYEGMISAIAPVGTKLSEDFVIADREIAGEMSQGMICALSEIVNFNIDSADYNDGVIDFGTELEIGKDVKELLNLDDVIFELGITPNRADLLNLIGQILESKAVLRLNVQNFDYDIEFEDDTKEQSNFNINISESDADICNHLSLTSINIKDFQLSFFEEYMLMINGFSLVNSIVDLGNYAMLVYGQPVHFYDADKVHTKNISVRKAYENEEFVGLNKKTIKLNNSDIVVANNNSIMSLAGIMGSNEYSVDENTSNVILEVGRFDESSIRKSSKRLSLSTDSSYRNERGISREATFDTQYFIKKYLQKRGSSVLLSSFISNVSLDETVLEFNISELISMSGYNFTTDDVKYTLDLLTLDYSENDNIFKVNISLRHNDFKINEDLFEEIIRIFGYDKLVPKLPKINKIHGLNNFESLRLNLRNYLVDLGFNQILTYSLVSEKENNGYNLNYDLSDIYLSLPQSKDREVLRNNLTSSLVKTIVNNKNNQQENIRLFEIGEIFSNKFDNKQKNMLTVGVYGNTFESFNKNSISMDFFYLKSILVNIFDKFGLDSTKLSFKIEKFDKNYHPYRTANVYYENEYIGIIGNVLHKKIGDMYTFEIDFDFLVEKRSFTNVIENHSIYPSTIKDFSLIVNSDERFTNIKDTIDSLNIEIIKNVRLINEFKDDKFGKNSKSILIRIMLNDDNKTLDEESISSTYNSVNNKLKEKYDVQ